MQGALLSYAQWRFAGAITPLNPKLSAEQFDKALKGVLRDYRKTLRKLA